jgi:flavin reductase (DIM6/NTAB) family NADH-FMN oxidoreductase RutF
VLLSGVLVARAIETGRGTAAPGRDDGPLPRALDTSALRSCLGRFGTGVCVVTVAGEGGAHGLTVNAFTAVSLEPPLVLVSIGKRARGHRLLEGMPFAVNVLGAEQEAVARHFSGDPRPESVRWEDGIVAPRLAGTLATFECRPWRAYDGGDHTLFVGEVVDFAYRGGDALGYFNSRFSKLEEPVLGLEHIFG